MQYRSLLRNGALLLTERVRHFQSLCIGVWIKAGSRQDRAGKEGLAHLLEHVLCKGSSSLKSVELARMLDAAGAEFDAMTSREYTCFILSLPLKEVEFALYFMKETFLNPEGLDSNIIAQEKKIILHEMKSIKESPEEHIDDILMEKTYIKHPMGKSILGTKKSISLCNKLDVTNFFKKYYIGTNMQFTVVGDVDHNYMKKNLDSLPVLISAKNMSTRKKTSRSLTPPKFHPGVYSIKRKLEQSHILIAYESYPIKNPNRWALSILNTFFGSGESSKLFQLIREEKALAYNTYSYLVSYTDTGLFIIYLATDAKSLISSLSIIKEEIEELKRNLIKEEDIYLIKNSLKNSMLLDEDSVETRMTDISMEEIYLGNAWSRKSIFSNINRVKSEDVRRVARDIFSKNPSIVGLSKRGFASSKIKKIFNM